MGSSPLTRGARQFLPHCNNESGIIPAYAGSTRKPQALQSATQDHPRLRGEHPVEGGPAHHGIGSSLLTRGAQGAGGRAIGRLGIIPAYAGSTSSSAHFLPLRSDHPRLRGEHRPICRKASSLRGSSPLTRGAPCKELRSIEDVGIIPAYAGSTSSLAQPWSCSRDHPRLRGEHLWTVARPRSRPGSSPLTRGAPW